MTTGTYLSKINTRTFFYGYFQQQKKLKNMHFGKKKHKKTNTGKSFECNLRLLKSDKNCHNA